MKKSSINDLVVAIGSTKKLMPDIKYVLSDEEVISKIESHYTPEMVDVDGRNLLMYAALHDRPKVVEWLLYKGEAINHFDKTGNTALHFAVQSGSVTVISLLIKHEANVNFKDSFGNSPIMRCNLSTPYAIFKILIENNANPYQRNNYGVCAIDVFQNNKEILGILKGQGDEDVVLSEENSITPK